MGVNKWVMKVVLGQRALYFEQVLQGFSCRPSQKHPLRKPGFTIGPKYPHNWSAIERTPTISIECWHTATHTYLSSYTFAEMGTNVHLCSVWEN